MPAPALIFLRASRILGFSDWIRPSMATFSTGYSRRKISVSPMWYASSTASVIFCIIALFFSGRMPGGASINRTGVFHSPFRLGIVFGPAHSALDESETCWYNLPPGAYLPGPAPCHGFLETAAERRH